MRADRRVLVVAGIVVGFAVVGATITTAGGRSTPLSSLTVSRPPAGWVMGPQAAQGMYTPDSIAEATPNPSFVKAALREAGIDRGYGHVFQDGSAFAVHFLMRAKSAQAATTLARSEVDDIAGLFGTAKWFPEGLGSAFGYLYNGTIRGRYVFCEGAWVAHRREVFVTYTCEDAPGQVTVVKSIMQEQVRRLERSERAG